MSDTGIMFHLPADWLAPDSADRPPFYTRLIEGVQSMHIPCRVVVMDHGTALQQVEADNWFHIFDQGAVDHPRALNAGIAYIPPFWQLDPKGICAGSSIKDQKFRPGKIDIERARKFYSALKTRWVDQRQSRYDQDPELQDIPEGCLSVFFQVEAHRDGSDQCYMDRWTMLETALDAWDGPVVVKPHPLELRSDAVDRLLAMANTYPHLTVSTANVHDILAASARVLTLNSAVGIEAYLHRKPVILCGQADFHHIADVAETVDGLARLLRSEPGRRVYAKYIYWFFGQKCLNAGRSDLVVQMLHRIKAQGYLLQAPRILS